MPNITAILAGAALLCVSANPVLAGGHGWEDDGRWAVGGDGFEAAHWRDAPPTCHDMSERDGDHWHCWRREPQEVSLPSSFFADSGGVGPDGSFYDTGGGGGFAIAGASAGAFAFASASASVSVRFHGGFGHRPPMPPHHGGCGCKR